jgi:hypothetical protein
MIEHISLGAIGHVIARPVLHDLLFRQIPKDRIHMNKKVLSTDDQSDKGITVTFSDGTSTTGDILIGADGAYSAVRQNLFKRLKAQNKLAAADDVPLPYSTICLVGQTRPLDPALFPHLLKDDCQFVKTLGENKPWVVGLPLLLFTVFQSTILCTRRFFLTPSLFFSFLSPNYTYTLKTVDYVDYRAGHCLLVHCQIRRRIPHIDG